MGSLKGTHKDIRSYQRLPDIIRCYQIILHIFRYYQIFILHHNHWETKTTGDGSRKQKEKVNKKCVCTFCKWPTPLYARSFAITIVSMSLDLLRMSWAIQVWISIGLNHTEIGSHSRFNATAKRHNHSPSIRFATQSNDMRFGLMNSWWKVEGHCRQ